MDKPVRLYTYENISNQRQMLRGYGWVEPGEKVTSKKVIENANFELIKEKNKLIKN